MIRNYKPTGVRRRLSTSVDNAMLQELELRKENKPAQLSTDQTEQFINSLLTRGVMLRVTEQYNRQGTRGIRIEMEIPEPDGRPF